jgi:hypothetical protein
MLRDRPADAEPHEPAPDDADVIGWGDEEASPPSRRRFRQLDRLRSDPRYGPLAVTALGLAAVFGSLVSDWARLRMREMSSAQFSPNELRAAASTIGVDSGYLVGILAIVALTALAIFGTSAVRHNARVAGMAVAAGVLVLLVGATVSLDATLNRMFPLESPVEVDVEYGSGMTLAYVATAALGLALYLSGRHRVIRAPTPEDGDQAEPHHAARRRARERAETDEPVRDVTVLPAPPFTGPDWRQQYPR